MSDDDPDVQERGRRATECIDRLERFVAAEAGERAAVQRRIADAIRAVPPDVADKAASIILSGDLARVVAESPSDRVAGNAALVLSALAACAKYPEILDAVNQVAAMYAAERGR